MNELQLSNNLTTIETEIKSYQNIAGQSIFEIGRRLKHVKENDLVHGEFGKWLEKVDINHGVANKMMKISETNYLNYSHASNLGVTALYEIATLPEEERYKEHITTNGETKTPDEMTRKELRELKKQIKQKEEQSKSLYKQINIANRKIEELENAEPEVVEKEIVKEVVPDDIKQQLEQFKQKFERESNNANELRDELQRYRNSFSDPNQAYEEKELTRLERESSINAHKIAISIQNFIKENSVETYRIDTVIKANPKSKERLQENVALLKEFTSNLEAMLNGRIVVN